jgi:hypothetical protein
MDGRVHASFFHWLVMAGHFSLPDRDPHAIDHGCFVWPVRIVDLDGASKLSYAGRAILIQEDGD